MIHSPSRVLRLWRRALALIFEASPGYSILWIALLTVQGVLPVAIAYLTKFAVDGVAVAVKSGVQNADFANAALFLALLGAALLVTDVVQNVSGWLRTAQADVFGDFLADRIHAKAGEVDLEFYESPDYHDLAEQVRGEAGTKPLALLENFGSILQSSIALVGLGALLFTYGWFFSVVLLVGSIPALYLSIRTDRRYHAWWRSTAEERRWTSYFDAVLTHPSSAPEVRLFGLNRHFRKLYQRAKSHLRAEKSRHLKRQMSGRIVASLLSLGVAVGAMIWMAFRVFKNTASLGDLGLFYQIFSRGQGLAAAFFAGAGRTVDNSRYLESLFAYLDLKPKIDSANEVVEVGPIKTAIRLRSVSFKYPGCREPVLNGLDLTIPAGSVAALVGVNGAGKSTLIKLLCRFYDPTSGSIEFDGIDIRRYEIAKVRRMVSVLFQFPMQYHASAAENIAYGDLDRDASADEIVGSATLAGAADFIERLPSKYDTLLGKWFVDGHEISGGEWQRLSLARAYFREAPIIILDEPTSFMDSWSEADWFDRFRNLTAGRTGIVITHRFTIAMRADIIHVIDDGRIIESGSHRELMELNGFYAESWKSQMKAAEQEYREIGRGDPPKVKDDTDT